MNIDDFLSLPGYAILAFSCLSSSLSDPLASIMMPQMVNTMRRRLTEGGATKQWLPVAGLRKAEKIAIDRDHSSHFSWSRFW
jgi:hypothetical protein